MGQAAVVLEGKIDPRVKGYWLWATPLVLACTIVLIPLAIVYVLVAVFFVDRYVKSITCVLTERNLIIKKGILNKTESTVPLGKITDLQMYQGPIMRGFGLKGFRVETAGQSSGPGGHLINMIGIVDTDGFREAVLAQRDRIEDREYTKAPAAVNLGSDAGEPGELLSVARDIRDALARIEVKLDRPSSGDPPLDQL